VSDKPLGPQVIVEDATGPRLDFGWEQAVAPVVVVPSRRWSALGRAAAGAALLVLGLSALDAANFVAAQFDRGPGLGWLTLAVVLAGYGLIASAFWAELRGLAALRAVDRARAAFARGDLATSRAEALRWAGGLAEAAPLQPALREAANLDELRALLESGPLRTLDARVAALGRTAALQAFAATAVSPSAGLDALLFTWRGVRLVRQVAALHGLRPGLAGTLTLLRRTVFDAATVALTDVALDKGLQLASALPGVADLLGAAGAGGTAAQATSEAAAGLVAYRRMQRLARAAAVACRMLP
jgi:putative membrane protein